MNLAETFSKLEQLEAGQRDALRTLREIMGTRPKWTVIILNPNDPFTHLTFVVEASHAGEAEFKTGLAVARKTGLYGGDFIIVGVFRGELDNELTRISLEYDDEGSIPRSFLALDAFQEKCLAGKDHWCFASFAEFSGEKVPTEELEWAWEHRGDYQVMTGVLDEGAA